ncbi:MAG: hypothetical protein BWY24_00165 [Microgenomates group bacterium ADurb.Bin219]|nr:MAG: hypothetical protein BWY24_00165 [Microgenomates group bacterium ADurb.Bin219]
MFTLSQTSIAEFKKIYQKEYGIELSDSEANRLGLELLEFFKLIYRPIPKENKEPLLNSV